MEPTVADYGEKRLIAEVVRPLFDGGHAAPLLGDDCAVLDVPPGHRLLVSTDRVPADLIAFQLGVLDHEGLGRYLAYLNLSDVVATGGIPFGLLFNAGLPPGLRLADFEALCRGFRDAAVAYGCRVSGGDISGSSELSLSATALGVARPAEVLRRGGARPGDLVFTTRPVGLTPAAFEHLLGDRSKADEITEKLRTHLASTRPNLEAGRWLAQSRGCTACMDNTDGVGQTLVELAAESGVALVVEVDRLDVPDIVRQVAAAAGADPLVFALGPGHDLSLVGTLAPEIKEESSVGVPSLRVIGRVEVGTGVFLERDSVRSPLAAPGWDYFRCEIYR